jgi:hypothetical protein
MLKQFIGLSSASARVLSRCYRNAKTISKSTTTARFQVNSSMSPKSYCSLCLHTNASNVGKSNIMKTNRHILLSNQQSVTSLLCSRISVPLSNGSVRFSSTLKKRRMKMNKHKLKKRRKSLKFNTKASRAG